ncbi:MAG: hypothetical protein Q8R83_10835 [Legionellaceae bacterium]|nr:hypothetical protein [Legionellaceae bacterium]
MNIKSRYQFFIRAALLVVGLFFSMSSHAWRGGGGYYHGGYYHGGYYHGNYTRGAYYGGYHGGYYGSGWAAPGVIIGVPAAVYYGRGCSVIQRCFRGGGCINERVCN